MKSVKCKTGCVPTRWRSVWRFVRRFSALIFQLIAVGVAWMAIDGGPVSAQRKAKQQPPPVERSYPMGYALALAAAGAAVFVVGRPHARVQESRPDDHDYP